MLLIKLRSGNDLGLGKRIEGPSVGACQLAVKRYGEYVRITKAVSDAKNPIHAISGAKLLYLDRAAYAPDYAVIVFDQSAGGLNLPSHGLPVPHNLGLPRKPTRPSGANRQQDIDVRLE